MSTSRKEKSNRGLLSRISPRSHRSSRKEVAVTPESLTIDHDLEDSVHSSLHDGGTPSASVSSVSVLTDDDPVEIIKKLRKNRLTRGIKGTAKAVKGAVSRSKGGTHRTARSSATKQNEVDYDVEAATVTDPLIPKTSSPPRSGKALWDILRNRRDEVIFMQHDDDQESVAMRKTRRHQEIINEFRNALEFSLPQCLVAIVVYLVIAVLAYSFVFEQFTFVDSCYFAVVSFTTIGYGDIVPTTDASRLFTAFYALAGVACLGIALGVLGSNLIEAQTKAIDQASELSRYQVMSVFDSSSQNSNSALDNTQPTSTMTIKSPWYQSMFLRQVLPLATLLFIFCWFLGNDAGWNAVETFYYCVITGTTVGFGDYAPQTQTGRFFAVPVVLLAVSVLGSWLSAVADAIIKFRQARFRERFQAQELTIADLEVMDADEDGKVTLAEYLSFMLVSMQAVDQDLIDNLTAQFYRLDVDGTGSLEKEDLVIVAKRKLHSTKRKIELAEYKQQLLQASGGSSYQAERSSALMSAISSKLH